MGRYQKSTSYYVFSFSLVFLKSHKKENFFFLNFNKTSFAMIKVAAVAAVRNPLYLFSSSSNKSMEVFNDNKNAKKI